MVGLLATAFFVPVCATAFLDSTKQRPRPLIDRDATQLDLSLDEFEQRTQT
jgi:hypothetical protein